MKRTNLIVVRIYTQATEVHWKKTDVLSCGRPLKSWLFLVIIILPQDVDREIQKNLFRLHGLGSKQLLRTENREVRRCEFIIKSKNLSLPRSRFQGITFRFFPQNAGVKLHPLKKACVGGKKKPQKVWPSYLSTCQVHSLCPLLLCSLRPVGDIWTFLALPYPVIETFDFLLTDQSITRCEKNRGWQLLSKARNRTSA